jgi:FkbM family methyltransferase
MQKTITDNYIDFPLQRALPVTDMATRLFEKIRLQLRAEKYRYKEDRGGIAYIREMVKAGDTVFDIGAHKGGYLYFLLQQAGRTGKIYAFEPQSVLNRYLCRLKHLFNQENLVVENLAVSGSSGTAMLCIPYNDGKKSSPCATIIESHTSFAFRAVEEVNTVSLDEYCSRYCLRPDFLKVDVEGNELAVFKGAEKILTTCKPKILFECEARFVGEQKMLETFNFLQSLDYKGHFIMDDTIKPIEEFVLSIHQNISDYPYCNNFIFD